VADKIEVKVEGVEQLLKNLKKYQLVKTEACRNILKEVGFRIELQAKDNIRTLGAVKTGRMMSSMSTNWSGSTMSHGKVGGKAKADDGIGRPDGAPGLVVVVGTAIRDPAWGALKLSYPEFVEFGTRKMTERPFLYPAYFSHEGDVEKRIKEVMKKVD
jgi:HK97 gp10 family phage protein